MISASFVEEALDSLRRRGLPTEGALAAAGLMNWAQEPVSAQTYGKLWLALALGHRLIKPAPYAKGGELDACEEVVGS
ncbi:hypothetical protein CH337_22360, partial [Rhodoblastus acidophilus]